MRACRYAAARQNEGEQGVHFYMQDTSLHTMRNAAHLLDGVHRVHFIGCGGSGMYPLIQILAAKGYEITGSDVLEGSIPEYER